MFILQPYWEIKPASTSKWWNCMDILSTITNLVGSPRFIFYFILLKQYWSVGLHRSIYLPGRKLFVTFIFTFSGVSGFDNLPFKLHRIAISLAECWCNPDRITELPTKLWWNCQKIPKPQNTINQSTLQDDFCWGELTGNRCVERM